MFPLPCPDLQWLERETSDLSKDGSTKWDCYHAILSEWIGENHNTKQLWNISLRTKMCMSLQITQRKEIPKTWTFICRSQCPVDHWKGNSISKTFVHLLFCKIISLQSDNRKVCTNGLWTKAFCCVKNICFTLEWLNNAVTSGCSCQNNSVTKGFKQAEKVFEVVSPLILIDDPILNFVLHQLEKSFQVNSPVNLPLFLYSPRYVRVFSAFQSHHSYRSQWNLSVCLQSRVSWWVNPASDHADIEDLQIWWFDDLCHPGWSVQSVDCGSCLPRRGTCS